MCNGDDSVHKAALPLGVGTVLIPISTPSRITAPRDGDDSLRGQNA